MTILRCKIPLTCFRYMTTALQKNDMRAVGLQLALDLLHEKEKRDLVTGLMSRRVHFLTSWNCSRDTSFHETFMMLLLLLPLLLLLVLVLVLLLLLLLPMLMLLLLIFFANPYLNAASKLQDPLRPPQLGLCLLRPEGPEQGPRHRLLLRQPRPGRTPREEVHGVQVHLQEGGLLIITKKKGRNVHE